jgi:hypothetical protein
MSKKIRIECWCVFCKKETMHTLIYFEGYLKEARCHECKKVTIDKKLLLKVYMNDLIDRVLTKLYRLRKELKAERQRRRQASLILKTVLKPLKETRRLYELLKYEGEDEESL